MRTLLAAMLFVFAATAHAEEAQKDYDVVSLQAEASREADNDEAVALLAAEARGENPAALTEQVKAGLPTGDDLVDVRLMPGIEQDAVFRGVEHPMQSEREFHHAEIRTKVSPGARHLGHEEIADLRGQDSEFRCGQLAQVTRAVDAGQEAGRVG